ncbi:MAG: hypothetical protein LBQ24_02700 [Candidatus Peribacteria bacterium]|nr:hypothetical protein [Candidatus Peribacteria bacterium]
MNDYHFLLRKKALYVQKVYNNQAINSIIQDLLNHINSRNPGFIQSVVCDVVELVNKDYSEKKNFFDILKDLAGDKYEFLFD